MFSTSDHHLQIQQQQQQQQQRQQKQQPSFSISNVINGLKQNHLLTLAIYDLCIQIQQTSGGCHTATYSNDIGMKLDQEAANYIESLILDVFLSFLSTTVNNFSDHPRLETAYSEAMSSSNNSNNSLPLSTTLSSFNSVESSSGSIVSSSTLSTSPSLSSQFSYKSFLSTSTNESNNSSGMSMSSQMQPILDLTEAKSRVHQAMPHSYADQVCSKALERVEKCRKFMNTPKRQNKMLKIFSDVQASSSQANNELTKMFKFPLDKLHTILGKEIFKQVKFDIFITIYLVYILEFIAKDILRLATGYVKCLNKRLISQVDIKTAIQADHALTKIFYSSDNNNDNNNNNSNNMHLNNNSDSDIFDMREDYDDEEDVILPNNEIFEANKKETTEPKQMKPPPPLPPVAVSIHTTSSSNEECLSDSSTICAETVSIEKLTLKYNTKVKELLLEQNQHLNDLNILRRIFMYLFRKSCSQFNIIKSNTTSSEEDCDIIESIFGNINDLYDCALRLADLLDENLISNNNLSNSTINFIGQYFWELAEGEEFSVYLKFALNVLNFSQVSSCIKLLLNNANVNAFLQQTSPGLAEISKYLLPKLLIGSIYHFLYMYETIEHLQQISTDDLDKTLLSDTLDTLKTTKYKLKELGYLDSKRRPIETSFRMFQPHQLQLLNNLDNIEVTNNNNNSVQSYSNMSSSNNNNTNKTNVSNIIILTRNKWSEIEKNVESFKFPAAATTTTISNNKSSQQFPNSSSISSGASGSFNSISNTSNSSSSIPTSSNNSMLNLNESNIKNAFLFEGYVCICKANQPNQLPAGNFLKLINQHNKYKISKRYAYLFDGILILVKRPLNNSINKYASRFKQAVSLGKCNLKDLVDDDFCIDLEVFNNNSSHGHGHGQDNNIFIRFSYESSKEKYQWMSMLCYSQYKSTIDRLLQTMTEEQNNNNPLPFAPGNYLFNQTDSPENILFEQTSTNQDGPSIRAATLVKLIERLTHHLYLYPKFSNTFLMFYREFCTSQRLFELLTQRYDVPDLNNLSQNVLNKYANDGIIEREILKRYKREYQQPIKLKVVNFIKHWINGYYIDDFSNDPDLLKLLNDFIEKVGKTNQRLQQLLINAFNQQKLKITTKLKDQQKLLSLNNTHINEKHLKSSSAQDLSINRNNLTDNDNNNHHQYDDLYPSFETHLETSIGYSDLLTIHPLEFARQATLMEFELFKQIRPNELTSLGWNKPDRNKLSPNLTKLINLSNKFTYWYAKCIVDTLNFDERVIVMQRILEIASYFYEMNNFSGMKQIYCALEASSVNRLELTREKAGVDMHKMYSVFKKLFENHERKYLEHIKKCNPPCVPFVGTHLTLILKKKEHTLLNDANHKKQILKEQKEQKEAANGNINTTTTTSTTSNSSSSNEEADNINVTFKQSNLINFSNYKVLVGFVTELLQYQNISYKFRLHEKIRTFILTDIEETFRLAEDHYNKELQHQMNSTTTPTALNDSISSSSCDSIKSSSNNENFIFLANKPDPSRMVEEWLFAKSKLIESSKEINEFPRTRRHAFIKVPPPLSDKIQAASSKSSKNINILTFKMNNKDKSLLNMSLATPTSDINNNSSSLIHKSPLLSSAKKNKQNHHANSLNLFTAPFVLANPLIKNETLNSNYSSTSGQIITSSSSSSSGIQSSSHSSIGSFIRSSSSFQKENRSSHKRSNSSVQISKQNNKLEQTTNKNTAQDSSIRKADNHSKQIVKNELNSASLSSFAISSNTSTFSLTSSSSAVSSSIIFPTMQHPQSNKNNLQIPSSSSPPVLPITNEKKPTLSSSSMNAVLSSLAYGTGVGIGGGVGGGGHGQEKLSLSSADSSSSAPNSPPPNYDEVFDSSSSMTSTTFSFANIAATTTTTNNNCFDNKTYFQRFYSLANQNHHSSSLNNLGCLETELPNVQKLQKMQQQQQQASGILLPVSPSPSESSASSINNSNFQHFFNNNNNNKTKNKQFSVFSFPDFAENNEDIEILKKKTSSTTSSIDILTPPPTFHISSSTTNTNANNTLQIRVPPFSSSSSINIINEDKKMKNQIFNSILTPPPNTPPPLPPTSPPQVPPLPTHLKQISNTTFLTPAVSQTSINSLLNIPAPPLYPPPPVPTLHQHFLNENSASSSSSNPPPVPARPKKKPV